MNEINFVKKLALWVFIIPFIATNSCLMLVTVFGEYLPPGIRIGKVFPYFDGGTSISRTARNFPAYLIFKPAMIFTSFLLIKYWITTKKIVENIYNKQQKSNYFVIFGILSAIFLILHSIFLGVKFDFSNELYKDFYKLFRRFIILSFIIFELVAQIILVYSLFKIKDKISIYIKYNVLKIKIILVTMLALIALASLPIITSSGNTQIKHALEWNFFLGIIFFYFLTFLMWKKN
tara:strand:+ start:186 stop:887 length:702 start_codon:yes stop_codon:yes gene_type:complete